MEAMGVCLCMASCSDNLGITVCAPLAPGPSLPFLYDLYWFVHLSVSRPPLVSSLQLTPRLSWAETVPLSQPLCVLCLSWKGSNGPCWLILAATLPLWMGQAQLCSVIGRVSRIHRILQRSYGVYVLNQRHTNTCKLQFSPLALHFLISFCSLFS